MKKILKSTTLSVVLLTLTIGLTACEDKEQQECTPIMANVDDCISILKNLVHDESASIIGKWRLERTYHVRGQSCADYSQCNIVFEFKPDGILTIFGKTGFTEFDTANLFYSFIKDEKDYSMNGLPYGLRIGNSNNYWYKITSKELMIDQRPHDGGAFYLVRINQNNNN